LTLQNHGSHRPDSRAPWPIEPCLTRARRPYTRRSVSVASIVYPPRLIIQLARGGAVDRQLDARALASISTGDVVVEAGAPDPQGHVEWDTAGQVVMSVPSPEALEREAGEVRRVIGHAGTGVEPLIVIVEAAEELREQELAALLSAATHASRPVILRIIRDA
jgi:hypothetical protein